MSGNTALRALVLIVLGFGFLTAHAQQAHWRLLMFDADDCGFCERWQREVGVIYAKTREGALAPLEQMQLGEALPAGVRLNEPVRYTPTFVVLNSQGSEIGRISGYLGEEQFWGLLGALLAAADKG